MKCDEIRERMPDVATGLSEATAEENSHLAGCDACSEQLKAMRATMALLDEWQTPEPSPYFDVRLQARLREEMARPQAAWLHWFRRPVLAAALTVLLGVGVGVYVSSKRIVGHGMEANVTVEQAPPGSAVGDLQSLDKNHDMYADFELLDDLDLQQNVGANP
jgi:predicted anti-sigma-YlaC factor YlaD